VEIADFLLQGGDALVAHLDFEPCAASGVGFAVTNSAPDSSGGIAGSQNSAAYSSGLGGCTRAEMYRRGFAPAMLNRLLLDRLAIAHVDTRCAAA